MKHLLNNLLFLIAVPVFLTGCITQQKCNDRFPPVVSVKDSIVYKDSIVEREKLITIPADSSWYEALLECDSLGQVKIKSLHTELGKRIEASIAIKNNVLIGKCVADSALIVATWNERHSTTNSTKTETKIKEVVRKVGPWYVEPLIGWFVLSLLYIIYRLIRSRLPI